MIAGVLFAVAQMERENLRENTKRGLQAAKARGGQLGKRPGKWVEELPGLKEEGLSVAQMAKRLGRSRQAVYAALQRLSVAYLGWQCWSQPLPKAEASNDRKQDSRE